MPPTPDEAKAAGRPRDPGIDAAILDTARNMVVEIGYDDTTLAAIAQRAGVSIPAIYRRWSSKAELIEEAVVHLDGFELPRGTGDLRADIGAWVRLFFDVANEPAVRAAFPGLMSANSQDPDNYKRLMTRGEMQVREALTQFITDAVAHGQAAPDCDADFVFDLIRGTTFLRALIHADADADGFCDRTTDAVLKVVQA